MRGALSREPADGRGGSDFPRRSPTALTPSSAAAVAAATAAAAEPERAS